MVVVTKQVAATFAPARSLPLWATLTKPTSVDSLGADTATEKHLEEGRRRVESRTSCIDHDQATRRTTNEANIKPE